jgi:hypothetical protein
VLSAGVTNAQAQPTRGSVDSCCTPLSFLPPGVPGQVNCCWIPWAVLYFSGLGNQKTSQTIFEKPASTNLLFSALALGQGFRNGGVFHLLDWFFFIYLGWSCGTACISLVRSSPCHAAPACVCSGPAISPVKSMSSNR